MNDKNGTTQLNDEIDVMNKIRELLSPYSAKDRRRMMAWVVSRLLSDDKLKEAKTGGSNV